MSEVSSSRDSKKCDSEFAALWYSVCALLLHLQDGLEGGPTWCLHECGAERYVVSNGDVAEQRFFVLCAFVSTVQ